MIVCCMSNIFKSNNVILYTGVVIVEINTEDGLKEFNNGSLIPKKGGDPQIPPESCFQDVYFSFQDVD